MMTKSKNFKAFTVDTNEKKEVIDITDLVNSALRGFSSKDGVVNIAVLHTTCALSVADLDPGTDKDYLDAFTNMVPDLDYRHPHDPSHVGEHILSTLIGTSRSLPIEDGKLVLGTWQRVVLIEFSGPRERRVRVSQ